MKKFKRLGALLLALIMTFAAASISASAMKLSDKDELNYSTAPEVFSWIYKNYTDGAVGAFTIHCSVATCRHHNAKNVCELESIDVRPNCNCHSGKCDESMCGSYDKK